MADLFSVANSILGKLGPLALEEVLLLWNLEDELGKLKNSVSTIQAVLLDAEEKQGHDNQVRDWLGKLTASMYDADDLLDDFNATERLRALESNHQYRTAATCSTAVRFLFNISNKVFYSLVMAHKIKALRKRLDSISADISALNLQVRNGDSSTSRSWRTTDSSAPEVVGRESDKENIIRLLLDSSKHGEIIPIIAVVGMGGLGKTTLAQLVFNDEEQVRSKFDIRVWVCVSDPFDVSMIVKNILVAMTRRKQDDLPLATLRDMLDEEISKRRYLLVLDDVWSQSSEEWDLLKKLLRSGGMGSRIIITTRSMKVATIASPVPPYVLQGLSPAESWSLFERVAFRGKECGRSPKVREIGMEIVEKCCRVPLAIKSVGNVLCLKDPETEWLPFMNNELSKLDQEKDGILPTLKLSYDHLPTHLKHCFLYCRLFPKDYEINVPMLIHLWIAQGFVVSTTSPCPEQTGLEYFKDLLSRFFFQEVKRDMIGNIRSCKMHDLIHDLATSLDKNGLDHEKVRHVSFYSDLDSSWKVPASLMNNAKSLRSFLLPVGVSDSSLTWEESKGEEIFSSFGRLRAIYLHDVQMESLSPSVQKLKHLRYLGFYRNKVIRVIPSFVTKLYNLQVLNLSFCEQLKELPINLKNLVNLSHLLCEGCSNLTHMPRGIGELSSLQTLSWFVVGGGNSDPNLFGGLDELKELSKLRGKLEIRNLGSQVPYAGNANLKGKEDLQSLTLRWKPRYCYDSDSDDNVSVSNADLALLESLQPHSALKVFRIYNFEGLRFPPWLSYLTNLVELWIVDCNSCDYLPPLHHIPTLKKLWIQMHSLEYVDTETIAGLEGLPVDEVKALPFFPSLEKLWIWNCPSLKGWWKIDCGGDDHDCSNTGWLTKTLLPQFPCLYLLEIKNCPVLAWMPSFSSLRQKLLLDATSFITVQKESLDLVSTDTGTSFLPATPLMPNLSWLPWLHNVIDLWIVNCSDYPNCLPPLDQLPCLTDLYLGSLFDLEYIETTGELERGGKFFSSLKKLWIWKCPNLRGWRSRKGMEYLPSFHCLSLLDIRNCPKLTHLPPFPALEETFYLGRSNFAPLQQAMNANYICGSHNFKVSSFLGNIKELWISGLPRLEVINNIEFLPFLKKLWVWHCANLKTWMYNDKVPATFDGHFPRISLLEIKNCPNLSCTPLFPSLDDKLLVENSSLGPLAQTMKMKKTISASTGPGVSPLSKLKKLSILGDGDVESIPRQWLQNLASLEELYVKNCSRFRLVPQDLNLLPCLQKLHISGCQEMQKSRGEWSSIITNARGQPTSIEIDWFVDVKDNSGSEHIGGLDEIKDLNGQIEIRDLGSKLPAAASYNFKAREDLHSLTLRWKKGQYERDSDGDFMVLESIQPHSCLKVFKVFNYGGLIFPPWFSYLSNLVQLWFVDCDSCTYLPPLHYIPTLKELWIQMYSLEYIDTGTMEGLEGLPGGERAAMPFFPSLEKLWIWNCPQLKGWWKMNNDGDCNTSLLTTTQMPCLKLLEIKNCPSLTGMPSFFNLRKKLILEDTGCITIHGKSQEIVSSNNENTASSVAPMMQYPRVNFPNWLSLLHNVSELWIVRFKHCPNYLPALDQLPFLRDLYLGSLLDLEYIETGELETEGAKFFSSLKKLWIWTCPNLEGWRNGEGMESLPSFRRLSLLDVRNCPKLTKVPPFPALEETFYLEYSNLAPLQQAMDTNYISGGHKFNVSSFLENIKELWISGLPELEEIRSIEFLPFMKKLWIWHCENLKSWLYNDRVATTIEGHFPRISLLEIKDCPNLSCMPLFPALDSELLVENSSPEPLAQTMTMKKKIGVSVGSGWTPLSKLKKLSIVGVEDVESLPQLWLQNLSSLQELYIKKCARLSFVPQDLNLLPCLWKLHISGCHEMQKSGGDWSSVISNGHGQSLTIEIDW